MIFIILLVVFIITTLLEIWSCDDIMKQLILKGQDEVNIFKYVAIKFCYYFVIYIIINTLSK